MLLGTSQHINAALIAQAARQFNTPFYLYDEEMIIAKCQSLLNMKNAFGLKVSYAMKANSNRALLQLITRQGLSLDLSSLNEGRRAHLAGIPWNKMMLTTQEVPSGQDRVDLQSMMLQGLKYNVCSLRQLQLIAAFARKNHIALSMRIHPGVGSGESVTRNTGDKYSCFGVHLSDLEDAMRFAKEQGLLFDMVHVHIGSGGDSQEWRENIDRQLSFVERFFPDAQVVNLGGGFKEARMPDETRADLGELGAYAEKRFREFYEKTGRKLVMAIEPGTFVVANAGYLVTSAIDKKQTGADGFRFLILDAGMEANTRPLLYGSSHPFYVISQEGRLLSSEYDLSLFDTVADARVVVGRCCESGDSQCLDGHGHIVPRPMADPQVGDFVVIGGTGAYCSAMTLMNYNSYYAPPEVLCRSDGSLQLIRQPQTLEHMTANEIPLEQS